MRTLFLSLSVSLSIALCGCGGVSEPTDAPTLGKCYAEEFGSSPPTTVKNLRAKQVIVGDAGGAWLRFETDSNTLSQITSNRFLQSSSVDFESYGDPNGGNTPKWWHPAMGTLSEFYVNTQW